MSGSGYPNNQPNPRRQVKFAVGFNGSCAVNSRAFFDQVYYSEDVALSEVICETRFHKNDILVFDRGLSGQQQLKGIMDRDVGFVGRMKESIAYVRCDSLSFSLPQANRDDTLEVI